MVFLKRILYRLKVNTGSAFCNPSHRWANTVYIYFLSWLIECIFMNMSDVSEGRVLLELTHRCAGEGEKVSWVPTGTQYTGIQCIPYSILHSRCIYMSAYNAVQ